MAPPRLAQTQVGHRFDDEVALMMNLNWLDHNGPDLNVDADAFGRSGEAFTGREQLDFQAKLQLGEFRLSSRYFQRKREGFFGVLDVLGDGSEIETYGGHFEGEWNHEFSNDLELKALAYVDYVDLDNYFVGRVKELGKLADAFAQHRIVVISGGAATGKSRLAAEYTHRSQRNGFWSTAGNDLTQTLIGLAPSLGVSIEGSDEDIANGVVRRLNGLTQKKEGAENLPRCSGWWTTWRTSTWLMNSPRTLAL